jgi:hypothetical protein
MGIRRQLTVSATFCLDILVAVWFSILLILELFQGQKEIEGIECWANPYWYLLSGLISKKLSGEIPRWQLEGGSRKRAS